MKINRAVSRRRLVRSVALAAVAYLGVAAIFSSASVAAPPIYVNGEPTSVSAIVRNDQMFVPVRGVFEKLNAAVTYTPPRTVVARKASAELVQLALGSRTATVNGATRPLQTAPFMSGSRIFVPLRLISEAAGAAVAYSATPQAVRITGARAVVAAAPVVAASPADAAASVAQQQSLPSVGVVATCAHRAGNLVRIFAPSQAGADYHDSLFTEAI
jgi:Copper amine oxidase N-terminal domain